MQHFSLADLQMEKSFNTMIKQRTYNDDVFLNENTCNLIDLNMVPSQQIRKPKHCTNVC